MKNGRIDSVSDFTPRGLGQLKSWLQPWLIQASDPPVISPARVADAIAAALNDPGNAREAAFLVLSDEIAVAHRYAERVAAASQVRD